MWIVSVEPRWVVVAGIFGIVDTWGVTRVYDADVAINGARRRELWRWLDDVPERRFGTWGWVTLRKSKFMQINKKFI